MATDLLYLHLHLIQSALGQKAETKPSTRECSQCPAVMSAIGVASLPGREGSRLGKAFGRASALRAKSVFSASAKRSRGAGQAVNGVPIVLVHRAVRSGTGFVCLTDEVLRHTGPGGRLAPAISPMRKAGVTCRWREGFLPSSALEDGSSAGVEAQERKFVGSERQNLRVPSGSGKFMGPVSPAIKATQWPGGTSSCLMAGLLSNSPQQLLWEHLAVGPR